jgi:hypothetical protein
MLGGKEVILVADGTPEERLTYMEEVVLRLVVNCQVLGGDLAALALDFSKERKRADAEKRRADEAEVMCVPERVHNLEREVMRLEAEVVALRRGEKPAEAATGGGGGVKLKGVAKYSDTALEAAILEVMQLTVVVKVVVKRVNVNVVRVSVASPGRNMLWVCRQGIEEALKGVTVSQWVEEGRYEMKRVEERVEESMKKVETATKSYVKAVTGGGRGPPQAPNFVPPALPHHPPSSHLGTSNPSRPRGGGTGGRQGRGAQKSCFNCMGVGHLARHCQNARRCRGCQMEGHDQRECPTSPPATKKCYNCHQEGHMAWECKG